MADAKSIFKRHSQFYNEIVAALNEGQKEIGVSPQEHIETMRNLTLIFCACIIAESIRNTMDDETQ